MNVIQAYQKLPKWVRWIIQPLYRKILISRMDKVARMIHERTIPLQCPTLICPPFTPEAVARYSKQTPVPACYYTGIPVMDPKKLPRVFIIETPYALDPGKPPLVAAVDTPYIPG